MSDKKVAIVQSCYIPWKGYFDLINMSDEFILFDDVQYTRRDWRNRNKIKTPNGLLWLTIPVEVKGKYYQKVRETKILENSWRQQHWKTIHYNYSKASFFKDYKDFFEELYFENKKLFLSEINYDFIMVITKILGINTKITWSSDYNIIDGKTERLVDLCIQANASEYISGPAAKDYIDDNLFKKSNIQLTWMDYSGYPEYHQLYPPFEHAVSIIDLIFNEGPNAQKFMKSFKN